jgi:hypothetical protein
MTHVIIALLLAVPGALLALVVSPNWVLSWRGQPEPKSSVPLVYTTGLTVAIAGILMLYFGTTLWNHAWQLALYVAGICLIIRGSKRAHAKQAALQKPPGNY